MAAILYKPQWVNADMSICSCHATDINVSDKERNYHNTPKYTPDMAYYVTDNYLKTAFVFL